MEAARLAVANHTARRGHTTEVHETVRPAVTRETVKPTRHEIITQAVDKEIHQHHYHTTVQPLRHTETLPAVHTHNLIPIKHTEHVHEDKERTRARIAAELAVFKDHSITVPVAHTREEMPAVMGEHYHHHVHETVQPVIFKETIKPEIVYTTMPIHETHHNEPVHHGISELAHKTLDEFTKLGGVIAGSKSATLEKYEGAPRPYKPEMATTAEKLGFTHKPRATTTTNTTTTTSTNVSATRNGKPIPAPIVTPNRNGNMAMTTPPTRNSTAVTPGLTSPTSNTSSPRNSGSMPTTPTHANVSDNTRIRDSENFNNVNMNSGSPRYDNGEINNTKFNGSPRYDNGEINNNTKTSTSFMDKFMPGRRSSEKSGKSLRAAY